MHAWLQLKTWSPLSPWVEHRIKKSIAMTKVRSQTPESRSYFARFGRSLGARQLPEHLTSQPQWWTLRDSQGRNPLMLAVYAKGATPDMLSWPHMRTLARQRDDRGRGIHYYLVRAMKLGHHINQPGIDTAEAWLKPLRDLGVAPTTTRSGWGLVIQHVMERPTRNWNGFMSGLDAMAHVKGGPCPHIPLCERSDWSEEDSALWWGGAHPTADRVAHWMNEVRSLDGNSLRKMARVAMHTLSPVQRSELPVALRGALLLNEAAIGRESDIIESELADGVFFTLSAARRARFGAGLGPSGKRLFDSVLAKVDATVLADELPSSQAPTPVQARRARL